MKKNLKRLIARNVKIVFFEMPIHPELLQSVRFQQTHEQVKTISRELSIPFISCPTDLKLETSDGVHLTPNEASQFYQSFLRQQVLSFMD